MEGYYRPDRGRVLRAEELEEITKFLRYMPENGTAVAPRTLAGVHPKGAYFTRGSGHNKFGGYTEIPDEYQEVVDRLLLKHQSASQYVPLPVIERRPDARFGVITTVAAILPSARRSICLRSKAFPPVICGFAVFRSADQVTAFIEDHDYCYVVEQSRDAQLRTLILNETSAPREKLRSIRSYGGFPLSASHVLKGIAKYKEAQSCRLSLNRSPSIRVCGAISSD